MKSRRPPGAGSRPPQPPKKPPSKPAQSPSHKDPWRELGPDVYAWDGGPEPAVVKLDGDVTWAWAETPKERLEAPFIADLWRQLCEELEKNLPADVLKRLDYSGRDQGRPSQRTLQGLCRVVWASPQRFFRDVSPPVKDALLYFLATDKLIRDPPKVSKPELVGRLVDQLVATMPNMDESKAIQIAIHTAANILGMRRNTAWVNYGRSKNGPRKKARKSRKSPRPAE